MHEHYEYYNCETVDLDGHINDKIISTTNSNISTYYSQIL